MSDRAPERIASVLIAAYRAEAWLEECVESVIAQRLPEDWRFELLVGVDGCRRTASVARSLHHRALTTYVMPANRGPYVMFNTLMQVAVGERILRFDADDVMRPGYLASQIDSTDRVDMSFCWSIYTDADLQPTSHVMAHEFYHPEGGERRRSSDGQFMMRRRVWDELGSFRAWRCAADTDFLHRAAAAGFTVELVEEFLYYRRTHPAALTAQPETNFTSELRKEYETFIELNRPVYLESKQARWVDPVVADLIAGEPAGSIG